MSDLLDHLSKDTLPSSLLEDFVRWAVFAQARPALVQILQKTGLDDDSAAVACVSDCAALARASAHAGQQAKQARRRSGPLGLSAAEAAAFLTQKMAQAAEGDEFDPEAVAFFAVQVCGWLGFAQSGFANSLRKHEKEIEARKAQEQKLRALWEAHQQQTAAAGDASD